MAASAADSEERRKDLVINDDSVVGQSNNGSIYCRQGREPESLVDCEGLVVGVYV